MHGIAIMSVREGLEFETEIASDTAPLHELVDAMIANGIDIHVLRDPTRGGVTSALTEIAQTAKVGMLLDEASIPMDEEVKGACEILGLDPLYVANEGKLLAIVAQEDVDSALKALRAHPLGERRHSHRRSRKRTSRIRDDENSRRRHPGGGHALGRTASANLLEIVQPKACVRIRIALRCWLAPRRGAAESLEKISRTVRQTPST